MSAAPVLQVSGLVFGHAGEAPMFSDWAVSLGAGLHRLDGESGSGKTTLLRLLAAELVSPATAGGLLRLNGLDASADGPAWRSAVCWVDARDEAFDDLTPAALRELLACRHPQLDRAAWQRQIDGFGLAPHAAKTMHMLSTGMRRKAALAAVLSSGAALMLLDEPLAGLDAPAVAWLVAELSTWACQPQRAALIVSGAWPPGLPCAGTLVLPTAPAPG